jgi:molybdopterin-guanine dinucleotide biosynthesis protein
MMPILGIATEKSHGRTTVTVPIHPEFAESLRAARAAGNHRRGGVHRQEGT